MAKTIQQILEEDVRITPDPVQDSSGRTKGSRSGLNIMRFWFTIFEANELLPKTKKMTNAEIARQLLAEYPGNRTIQEIYEKPTKVNLYRTLYNTGRLLKNKPGRPKHISFRYNEQGDRIDARTGRPFTAEQVKAYIEKYSNYEPKKLEKPRAPRKKKRKASNAKRTA